jgi:hypothetical protein
VRPATPCSADARMMKSRMSAWYLDGKRRGVRKEGVLDEARRAGRRSGMDVGVVFAGGIRRVKETGGC